MPSGIAMAVRNHDEETKGCIWLETTDGTQQEVEDDVAMLCPFICRETLHQGKGSSTITPVVLPPQVTPSILGLILEYCSFHQVPGRSNKERKLFNERFIRLDTKRLCELTSAADSLQMKPLVDLTSRALARMIEGKTPEEIRETFHLPDDLTEEEKLEPLKNTTDDPRIRLLNRLYARKRKELQEKDKSKSIQHENCHNDERSVEDLVSFINGESEDSKSSKAGKCKKKRNRRKKDQAKDETMEPSSSNGGGGLHIDARGKEVQNNLMFRQMRAPSNVSLHLLSLASGSGELSFEADFDDGDLDDGLDPVMKEKLDREVEDFARRLNSDWPERRRAQDIASVK